MGGEEGCEGWREGGEGGRVEEGGEEGGEEAVKVRGVKGGGRDRGRVWREGGVRRGVKEA